MGTVSCLIVMLLVYNGANASGKCGVRFLNARDDSSFLEFPGYANKYESNRDCTWTIEAWNVSQAVSVEVIDSTLEGGINKFGLCVYDNLTAYDGPTSSSRMIWSWCGTETPNILSTGRYLTLRFRTHKTGNPAGFRLKYQQTTARCGAQLSATDQSQYLSSPGYPSLHSNNLNCTWTIRTRHPEIKLEVTTSSLGNSIYACAYNKVQVYDGKSNRLLGTFCGHDAPTYISSSSLVNIVLVFITNRRYLYNGFQMKYTGGDFQGPRRCGSSSRRAYSFRRYLALPNYPNYYTNLLNCKWIITASSGSNIKLVVLNADIESAGCNNDKVKVFDGSTTETLLLGTFCGSQTPTYVSSNNAVTVNFQTDGTTVGKGFRLSYKSGHFEVCNHKELSLYASKLFITSPYYPLQYPNGADCTWTINSGNYDSVVYAEVTYLDIEYKIGCSADYLQAMDGRYAHSSELAKWCGKLPPSPKQSSGQYMFISFHSNGNTKLTGFIMQFSSKHEATKSHSSSHLGAIIGGIAAGCVLLLFIICYASCRARKNRPQRPEHSNPTSQVPTQRRVIYVTGGNESETNPTPITFRGLPSYAEVIGGDQGRRDKAAEDPPPPYSSLCVVPGMHARNSQAGVTTDDETANVGTRDDLGAYAPDTHQMLPRERDPKVNEGNSTAF